MELNPLEPTAFHDLRALLDANDLPAADIDDPSITFVGAFDGPVLVGVVGLQACDGVGLLRSLVVRDAARSRGIAQALCERVVELARARRLGSLWLLTTSARDYFTRRGFEVVERDSAPDAIRGTAQFASLCPSTAIVMRRALEVFSRCATARRSCVKTKLPTS
jgi:amino-acid N-acetyltransferase